MRICFLADGRSIHTYRFVKYFVDRGHKVALISMRPVREDLRRLDLDLMETPLTTTRFIAFAAANLLKLPAVLSRIRRFNPDVLHVHDAFCYGFFAWLSRRPYILTPWGTDVLIMPNRNRAFRSLVCRAVRGASMILYDGGAHMLKRLRELGAPAEKLHVFAFGVDVRAFSPANRDEDTRRQLGADSSQAGIVISTRNFEPVYDIATFIRASALILERRPHTRFVLVGDGSLRGELEAQARSLGVADRMLFTGRIPMDRMARCLASSDVYVSSSLSDAGIAASTAEAMASGMPAVITDFGDNGRWVRDGQNGFLFPSGDAETLARKVTELLAAPELRRACGAANVDIIRARNNYYVEMERVESLYRQCAGSAA